MTPETRAMIVWLLEIHSVTVVHAMMRRNPNTAPIEHQTIRSIRRSMLRAGAEQQKKGVPRLVSSEVYSVISAMLETSTPAEVFRTLSENVAGKPVTLDEIKLVRRYMLKAGAVHSRKRGPKPRFTKAELVERRRTQQKERWQAIQAKRQKPIIVIPDCSDYEGTKRLADATEAMFARKAQRLGCSIEAARLATLYSRAQLEQRIAA